MMAVSVSIISLPTGRQRTPGVLIVGKYEKKRPARSSRMMNRVFFWGFAVVIAVIVFLAVLILGKGAGDSETTSQTEPEQTLQLQTTGEKEIMAGTQSQPSNEGALLED